jgi:hypothetical protein
MISADAPPKEMEEAAWHLRSQLWDASPPERQDPTSAVQ